MPARNAFSARKKILVLVLLAAGLAAFIGGPALLTYTDEHQKQVQHQWHTLTGKWGDGSARFTNVSDSAGLHYQWQITGPRPLDILQTIGNGCTFLDYDNDGNLDILLVGPKLALYKGDGKGHFTDVTQAMGLDKLSGHFLGCAVGDYDNDGYDDIYVSGYQTGLLLHNTGGKGFRDVTAQAGLMPQPWGSSATFGDIDRNGRLDLYVCNYLNYDPSRDARLCALVDGIMGACPPMKYGAEQGILYHNEGSGHFRNVTAEWGAQNVSGKALAAAFSDYEGSGQQSLVIANDQKAGDLLQNQGGHFQNVAPMAGTAYLEERVISGMGVDWGDYDNDGRSDLFVSSFTREPKPIYHNLGGGVFDEVSASLGFREPAINFLAFGGKWLDYDNDGWLDLIFANGHIRDTSVQYGVPFLQPTLLFRNEHGSRLVDMSESAGPDLARPILGRGLAVGDFDNDGKVDALVVDSEGSPLLLHNESKSAGHWLSFSLAGDGVHSNRDGYGAAVTVTAGGLTQVRVCHADGSYLSSSDKRVHVGIGGASGAEAVKIVWPDGHRDSFAAVAGDRQYRVREGQAGL